MTEERTFIFDFIVSNISFYNPEEYKLSEITVNLLFLEAKLELNTNNALEFREGRSFEFKSTQDDLKNSLSISSIQVYVQSKITENEPIILDSYTIDWSYRLFEKLDDEKFTEYSQLEQQDIVYNGNVIGSIIMGFQLNAKDDCSKYDELDESKSDSRKLTYPDLSIGDSLKGSSQFHMKKSSEKCIDPNDVLFVIGDETSSMTNTKNSPKFISQIPFDGPINLQKFQAFQKKYNKKKMSQREKKTYSKESLSEISHNIKSKYSNKKYLSKLRAGKNENDESEDNLSLINRITNSRNSSRFKIRKFHSNFSLKPSNRCIAGGRCNWYEEFLKAVPADENDDNTEEFSCSPYRIKMENNLKCTKNYPEYNTNRTSKGFIDKCASKNQSPVKSFLKCKNSAVNKILDEYDTSEGGGTVPHLSQILSALKAKYGEELTNGSHISSAKCLPEGLENKMKNSKPDPSCDKLMNKRKGARFKFNAPACLTRKSVTTHGSCQRKTIGVPKNMGWLWSLNKEMVSKGWKPGAISYKIKKLMNHFLKDYPADTLPVFRRDKKVKTNKEPLVQKPTLRLKKCGGEYIIVIHPLKSPEDIACSADPYLNMKPIKFTIKKTDNSCSCGESDEEFDVEFTPPAGLIKPKLINRPTKACKETQYVEDDYNFKPVYETTKRKFDQIPAFCKAFVKQYNIANRPPCKMPAKTLKKGRGKK